jgi:hypothetical protein
VEIQANKFDNNTLTFMQDFILKHNRGLHAFFPPDYFKGAFSPLINIQMQGRPTE